jgi:Tol biopolymer transport system component
MASTRDQPVNCSLLYSDDGDWSPVWSPDGERIAFVSDRYGDYEIFVMNADGTDVYSTGQKGRAMNWGG